MNLVDRPRRNCFDVFFEIERRVKDRIPTSLIRLGDGEAAYIAYPELASKSQLARNKGVWFGDADISFEQLTDISGMMRESVRNSDILGIPRDKQLTRHPYYALVVDALDQCRLLKNEHTIITDAAIHRYLQFALLFRRLLNNKDFVGLITSRDIEERLRREFRIESIRTYQVRGERKWPGNITLPHYPEGFEEIERTLDVPYQGALFLVGAGGLGKVYCDWIKQRGGIAIDIGSLFDAWAGVKSRLVHPAHQLQRYTDDPLITLEQAISRYNEYCDHFELDSMRVDKSQYSSRSSEAW